MALPYNLQWARDDLDKALSKLDVVGVRHGLQEVLTQLSLGVDVSPLLGSVVMATEAHDIPCKRMVYTIMTSIARKDPDTTILITNTLLKDCSSDNPIVRGMALRAICDIEVTTMADELPKIISLGLADTNPYVRRMAVLATVHLQKINPDIVKAKGIVNRLYELLRDRDPQIICNSLFALSYILKDDGGINFDSKLIHHLVNTLTKFSEWAQSEALQVISQYKPSTDKERIDLMNIIDQFLSSSAASVMVSATKVLMVLTNERNDLQKLVVGRVIPKFITHIMAATPEVQYSLVKHLVVMARRFPAVFRVHIPSFYVSFNDHHYVAGAKFELLTIITDENFARDVIETTSRYILLEKPFTAENGIKLLRNLALRLNQAVPFVINKMRNFFDMKRKNLINHCLYILPDLMRQIPHSLADLVSLLPSEPPAELSGPALAAYSWILGEFGDRVPDSVYCLEHLMLKFWNDKKQDTSADSSLPSAHDEQSMMKISIMTSLAKMLFVSPGESRPVLANALALGMKDNHPGVKARAEFIYKMLKIDKNAARSALLTSKRSTEPFVEDADSESIDMVFDEFNSFSVIYNMPQADWDTKPEEIKLEIEEEEAAEESEHKLDAIEKEMELTPEMFEEMWNDEGVVTVTDSLNLGFELEVDQFAEAAEQANVGIIAKSSDEGEGSRVFAYGYQNGNIVLIESVEQGGELSFTIKAETEEIAECFKDFWLGFFNE